MFILGIDNDAVVASTGTPEHAVGTLGAVQSSDGTKLYLYVHAAEAITGAGYLCVVDSAGEAEMADLTSTAAGAGFGTRCGAAQTAVADNEWFWIQVYGKGSLRTAANAALGTRLNSTATAGVVDDDGGVGSEVIAGLTLGTATGGAEATNTDAYFNFPFVSLTL